MKRSSAILLILMLVLSLAACGKTAAPVSSAPAETTPSAAEPAEARQVELEIRDYGKITLELYPDIAPQTVENFLNLVESGFYDGLTFHWIIRGFMMQGGDPTGTGRGGSDRKITGEFTANGFTNTLSHVRGVISMARSQDMNSASSQFFIMHQDSPHLDGQYAAFGKVLEGMDVVDRICEDAKPTDNNGTIPAAAQPVITAARILK